MNLIKIKGGTNFNFEDSPENILIKIEKVNNIAILNDKKKNIKPKVIVKIGEKIKKGQELFYDKKNINTKFVSPNNGIIKDINYGERRKLNYIEIETNNDNSYVEFQKIKENEIKNIDKKKIINNLIISGLLKRFINFPDLEEIKIQEEKNIFNELYISLFDNQPLNENDINFILKNDNNTDLIILAISILSMISDNIFIYCLENCEISTLLKKHFKNNFNNINFKEIENKYPTNNFRLQYIYNKKTLIKNKQIKCTGIDIQSLIEIGFMFKNGYINSHKYYSISGNGIEKKIYLYAPIGINIDIILEKCITIKENIKIIKNGILTGDKLEKKDYLNEYDNSIQVIKEDKIRTSFVLFRLGNNFLTKTNAWLSSFTKKEDFKYKLSDSTNGEERPCIQCNYCTEICPIDIFPSLLMKSSLIKDSEKMEKLFIYNCIECELCSFICPSKIEICKIIKNGKLLIHNAG